MDTELAPFGFDREFWDPFSYMPTTLDVSKSALSNIGSVSVDLMEDDKSYTLMADLPVSSGLPCVEFALWREIEQIEQRRKTKSNMNENMENRQR